MAAINKLCKGRKIGQHHKDLLAQIAMTRTDGHRKCKYMDYKIKSQENIIDRQNYIYEKLWNKELRRLFPNTNTTEQVIAEPLYPVLE